MNNQMSYDKAVRIAVECMGKEVQRIFRMNLSKLHPKLNERRLEIEKAITVIEQSPTQGRFL